jgi:hypothetical protein
MSKWIESAIENDFEQQTEKPGPRLTLVSQLSRSDAEEVAFLQFGCQKSSARAGGSPESRQ